jgi:hypothetical protein
MRRRGAASWAWTCSISYRCVVPARLMNELDEDEGRLTLAIGAHEKKERTRHG